MTVTPVIAIELLTGTLKFLPNILFNTKEERDASKLV